MKEAEEVSEKASEEEDQGEGWITLICNPRLRQRRVLVSRRLRPLRLALVAGVGGPEWRWTFSQLWMPCARTTLAWIRGSQADPCAG